MPNEYIEIQNQVYRIRGTRVALDSIIYKFRQGRSPEAMYWVASAAEEHQNQIIDIP